MLVRLPAFGFAAAEADELVEGDEDAAAKADGDVLAVAEGEALLWAKAVLAYTPPATISAEAVPPRMSLRLVSKTIEVAAYLLFRMGSKNQIRQTT